jgi:hypothetical protein
MVELEQVRTFVEQHREELEQAAGTAEFPRELDNLERYWAGDEEPAQKLEETLRILRKYPAVWSRLALAGVVEPAVRPSPGPARAPAPPPPPEAPPVAVAQPPPPESRTPIEAKLAYIRELVTGSIGVLIVLVSLFCTVVALFRGHDMFPFLSGLVGVVLGYYFGRAPGEAQAAKSQIEVRDARKELDQMTSEVRSVLESTTGATARSSGGMTMDAAQLERLRRLASPRYSLLS